MSHGASDTRRALAVLASGSGQPAPPMVGSRSLHHYWALLMPHFRGILLPPQLRSDGAGTQWSWREPVDGPPLTASEIATVRKRLSTAQLSLADSAEATPESAPNDSRRAVAILPQVQTHMRDVISSLIAQSDQSLAGYIVRSERGLMLHSWGLSAALAAHYPDGTDCEIGGTVFVAGAPSAGHDVQLENSEGLALASIQSDTAGRFRFLKIPAGRYRTRVASTQIAFPFEGVTVDLAVSSVSNLELHDSANQRIASLTTNDRSPSRRGLLLAFGLLFACVSTGTLWWRSTQLSALALASGDQHSFATNSSRDDRSGTDSLSAPLPVLPARRSVLASRDSFSPASPASKTSPPLKFSQERFAAANGFQSNEVAAVPRGVNNTVALRNSTVGPVVPPTPISTTNGGLSSQIPSASSPSSSSAASSSPNPAEPNSVVSATVVASSPLTVTAANFTSDIRPRTASAPPPSAPTPSARPPSPSAPPLEIDHADPNTPTAAAEPSAMHDRSPSSPIAHESLAAVTPDQPKNASLPLLPNRLQFHTTRWQSRLGQDAILPTRPTRIDEDDAVEILRERLFRERKLHIPPTLQTPDVRCGFALEVVSVAIDSTALHWRDVTAGSFTDATVLGPRAECSWPSTATGSLDCTLLSHDGRALARVIGDPRSGVTLFTAPGVQAWPWLGLVRSPAETSTLTVAEWSARFDWRVLNGPSASPTWLRNDRWLFGQGHRLDLVIEEGKRGLSSLTLALVDRITGWSIVSEIELTLDTVESSITSAPRTAQAP